MNNTPSSHPTCDHCTLYNAVLSIVILCSALEIVIGFEETDMTVYEDAGDVKLCVKILQPSPGDINEEEDYPFNLFAGNTGMI